MATNEIGRGFASADVTSSQQIKKSRAVLSGGYIGNYVLEGTSNTPTVARSGKSGNNQPHNNIQPTMVMSWIIKT